MAEITVLRIEHGYTFVVNGRLDAVVDPEWGVTMFRTPEAAREAGEAFVREISLAVPEG